MARSGLVALWPLSLGALLWFAWSGVRAGEQPRTFWRLTSLATAALLLTWVVGLVFPLVVASVVPMPPADFDFNAVGDVTAALYLALEAIALLAYVLLLAAFARFMPAHSEDPQAATAEEA